MEPLQAGFVAINGKSCQQEIDQTSVQPVMAEGKSIDDHRLCQVAKANDSAR